ncbi:hypothetical protein FPZ12_007370 [Amycolatopsis acidicola]|uniref:Reverse transcriptase domain-containing protein n=1 Tax=Amycolatopsis acidicola TaxID=2596893 RepID=A0A5N0VDM6_9PSEU|nr:hypothetical protein FPZ12_007370 [Amycolatopsis acidicola]
MFPDELRSMVEERSFLPRASTWSRHFLKAGILSRDLIMRDTRTGPPQGGILSPLLANIALSVLDEYIASIVGDPRSTVVERARRKRHGLANFRLPAHYLELLERGLVAALLMSQPHSCTENLVTDARKHAPEARWIGSSTRSNAHPTAAAPCPTSPGCRA